MNINSTSTNSSRITGLATGMDTEAMVKQGVAREQANLDKVNQSVQYLKWQQEAYVDVIKDLKDFNNFFDILKSDNMMSSSNYAGVKAVSSAENVATAKALPGAMKGNYEVKVNGLAQGATSKTDKLMTVAPAAITAATGVTKLSDLGLGSGGEFKITVNGKPFTVKVDGAGDVNKFINDLKNTKCDTGTELLGSYVNISFSELTSKITIETKGTGKNETLNIQSSTKDLGKLLSKNPDLTTAVEIKGQNANISIKAPGETDFVTVDNQITNNFVIDNINYNLISTSPGSENPPKTPPAGTVTTITAKSDATEVVDKFKKFIEKYNAIVEKFNTKLTETKQYTYKPLTDAQRSSMKEDEIKNWETAAKKGILRRDENITKVLSGMRSAMINAGEGAGISLSEIGISTTSNYMDGGKLKLDETKLTKALEEKGDLVQKLFTQNGATDKTKGIFQSIKGTLDTVVGLDGTLIKKAGYIDSRWSSDNTISKNIKDKNQKISDLKKKMATKQQQLYSLYATLEKNMNKLNSQSNWLGSQLG